MLPERGWWRAPRHAASKKRQTSDEELLDLPTLPLMRGGGGGGHALIRGGGGGGHARPSDEQLSALPLRQRCGRTKRASLQSL